MSGLIKKHKQRLEKFTEGNTHTEDLDWATHISLKHKYIYVETPKVACSTIKMTLQRLELESPDFFRENFEDLHLRDFSPLLTLKQLPNLEDYFLRSDFFTFCFVRNPYSRLLSCYLDKIAGTPDVTDFKEMVLKSMGMENNTDYPISFEEFVSIVEKQAPLDMDYHWRPQTYLTCQNTIQYDFIGRLESFNQDFQTVSNNILFDLNKYYALETRHQTDATNLSEKYYTDDLYARVYKIYEIDFVSFSYNR